MIERHHRKIRSFVRRPGRLTRAQQRALDTLWPRWGIDYADAPLDLDRVFGRAAPRVLDIGFGDGEALITAVANHPGVDYLGVEVHEPGIGHLLVLLERAALSNVRVIARDAVDVIAGMLPPRSFDVVDLFFPDPWPKKRHHKRRLLQPEFVAAVARVLKPGGLFHVATDWADYAEHTRAVMAGSAAFEPVAERGEDTAARDGGATRDSRANVTAIGLDLPPGLLGLASRPPTKFERRGRRLGHEVVDLRYRRL